MNTSNLLFFNKTGNMYNFTYNPTAQYFEGKMLFEPNSSGTFKTETLYVFEQVPSMSDNGTFTLNRFQLFNDGGYTMTSGGITSPITLIAPVNTSSSFKSKWVYGTNFEQLYPLGTVVKFAGLTGEFAETSGGSDLVYIVVETQPGAVMLLTANTNNTFSAPGSYSSAQLISLDAIQWIRSSASWNENGISTLSVNRELTLYKTLSNDGVYTVQELTNSLTQTLWHTSMNASPPAWTSPVVGSQLGVDVTFFTDRVMIYNGSVSFNSGYTMTFVSGVPSLLQVGQIIVSTSGTSNNQLEFYVTAINTTTNVITVSAIGFTGFSGGDIHTISTEIFYTTNILSFTRDIVVYNGIPNPVMTMAAFAVENLSLFNANNINVWFDSTSNSLVITTLYAGSYINVVVSKIVNGVKTPLTTTTTVSNVDIIVVEQPLIPETQAANSVQYSREILFTSIDTNGLSININGRVFAVQSDGVLVDAINAWYAAYVTDDNYLLYHGINVTITSTSITLSSTYPNVPITMQVILGSGTVYTVRYMDITVNSIVSVFTVTINGDVFITPFITDIPTTLATFVATYTYTLKLGGITISSNSNVLSIGTLVAENNPTVTVNTGVQEKYGLGSYSINMIRGIANYTVVAGNQLTSTSVNFMARQYATGQTFRLSGALRDIQNISYNILSVKAGGNPLTYTLGLSYQGPFWNDTEPMVIITDPTIRFPRSNVSDQNAAQMVFSWEDTLIPDIFFYDFSGTQLTAQTNPLLTYTGPTPLIGSDGSNLVRLNSVPNTDTTKSAIPSAQQTVFDTLTFDLEYLDSLVDISTEPSPMQAYIGFNTAIEGVSGATLFVYMLTNLSYLVPTALVYESTPNDLMTFTSGGVVTLSSPSVGINFVTFGIKVGQNISFNGVDPTNKAIFQNNGSIFQVISVTPTVLTVSTALYAMVAESNVYSVITTTPPYFDIYGNPITVSIPIPITIKIEAQPIAQIQVYGETEVEDTRFAIHLHNFKKNVLLLSDFFIFRHYDINEAGVDWRFINKKRKELIQVFDSIFDNADSYTGIKNAISFFGYNDLSFYEYYRNVNLTSQNFGQLFSAELIGMLNPATTGWTSTNQLSENYPNSNYLKTNLFGLSYQITDMYGNFVDGFSPEEVQIKLLGLKNWIQTHVMAVGSKLLDIDGKIYTHDNQIVRHQTYGTKGYDIRDSISPVTFTASGYLYPVSSSSSNYNITLTFACNNPIEYYNLRVTTFSLDTWVSTQVYQIGNFVFNNGNAYKCLISNSNIQPGGITDIGYWVITTSWNLQAVQQIDIQRFDLTNYVFAVNQILDPHFRIEVTTYNGYGGAHSMIRTYSLQYGVWNNL